MVPWWSILIALVAGGLATSIVEYKLKYNLTDRELDLLKGLYGKANIEEQNLIAKLGRFFSKLEFWKKA